MRDRGHLHRHIVAFECDVPVALAERPFRFEELGVDQALDDELGIRRQIEIDGERFHGTDRRARKPAGDRHLVAVDRQFLRSGEHYDRRAADDDRDRHRLFKFAVFLPMQVTAGAARAGRHAHAEPVGGFELRPIGAHVANAGLGIARDA